MVPAKRGDKLEMDELWSFVQKKANPHWIWLVVCRRTRQVIAAAMGARDEPTCRRLWNRIPEAYRRKYVYTDFYATYFCVVPEKQQLYGRPVGALLDLLCGIKAILRLS